jgi:hypothetical protein
MRLQIASATPDSIRSDAVVARVGLKIFGAGIHDARGYTRTGEKHRPTEVREQNRLNLAERDLHQPGNSRFSGLFQRPSVANFPPDTRLPRH